MPGPWNGPVRVVEVTPTSFRYATLDGHPEAGQIEFSAADADAGLRFRIESWTRSGDPTFIVADSLRADPEPDAEANGS